MKKLIVLVLVVLASIGFMQTDPDLAEEMRQLKLEARAMQVFNPAEAVELKAVAEARGSAQALEFNFDDSGFDYYDKEEGRVHLDYGAGVLTLNLSEDAEGMVHSFPEIGRLNPEEHNRIYLENHHALSNSEKRDLLADEKARLRERASVSEENGSLELIHEDAYLKTVEDYYLNSLRGFGFSAQPDIRHAGTRSYRLKNGTHEADIVFTRMGSDIRVQLANLS